MRPLADRIIPTKKSVLFTSNQCEASQCWSSKQQFQWAISWTYRLEPPARRVFRGALERSRPLASAKVRDALGGPSGSGPVQEMREKSRVILRPLTSTTFSAPNSSSLEMAQRETNPIPSPASTADLIASVESRFITLLNNLSLRLAFSRAVSTTRREPEPCSRMSRFEAR